MIVGKRKVLKRAERQAQVAALYKKSMPMTDIAKKLGCSSKTVSRDIVEMTETWRDQGIEDIKQAKIKILVQLEDINFQAAIEYAASKDSVFLLRRIQAIERISNILGINAPDKLALTDPSGENPYQNLSDEELISKVSSIIGSTDGSRSSANGAK